MSIKRKLFILTAAFMIGISNAILEEDRMINDSRDKIEYVQDVNDHSID